MIEENESTQPTIARQTMSVEEESAYDTLENVMQKIRGERFTPYSPSGPQPTPAEHKGLAQARESPVHVRAEAKALKPANELKLKTTVSC